MDHLYLVQVEDAQQIALQHIGRRLCEDELERVKKGFEWGMELVWEETIIASIDDLDSIHR